MLEPMGNRNLKTLEPYRIYLYYRRNTAFLYRTLEKHSNQPIF